MADPTDFAASINESLHDGWVHATGVRLVKATRDEVVAELEVAPAHLQAYGIVHGGVHCGVIETLASVGAAIDAMARGQTVVGLENHTTFVRAMRSGTLRATAKPLTRGRRTQVWEGTIVDESGKLVATGRVRLLCLEAGAELAGERAEPKEGPAGEPVAAGKSRG
jgi:1,4-dihydroxy-2-naphthoyl-CoA hydrolase